MQYFKHMTNMRHDIKIDRLISKYGLEGYGLYVLILECIAAKLSTVSPIPDLEETSEDMARKYKIDTIKAEEIMLFCINQGLFDKDEISGRIICHKMYKFLDSSMTGSPELRKMIKAYKEKQDVMKCHEESGNVSTEENRIEKNRIEKNIARTGKNDSSPLSFTCDYFSVTENKLKDYAKAYPGIDLKTEFGRMKIWLDDNPARRKNDYPKFINNWLSRAQPAPVPQSQKSMYGEMPIIYDASKDQ